MDRLDRRFTHFEAEEAPIVEPGLEQPSAEAPEAPAPEAPANWSVSQEDWEQSQQLLSAMAQAMSQPQQPEFYDQQQPELPEYDPFDPNSVQNYVDQIVQQQTQSALQQTLGPLEPLLGHIAESEGEKMAREELGKLTETIGAFDQDQAVVVAQGLLQQGYEADQALRLAAERTHQYEESIRASERESYKKHLETLSGAPTPTPAGGAAAGELESTPTGTQRYRLAVENALRNGNPVHPTG